MRTDITFPSHGNQCAAWLYLPEGDAPAPVIVMAHGLGGTREMRLDAYAERFRAEGYACLVFDYRHFGASEGEPRQLLDIGKQHEDWASAIACARGLDGVDGDRVILWGTSFSGGHVLVAAARDGGITAVIAQCPYIGGKGTGGKIPPAVVMKLAARALADRAGAALGLSPVHVALVGRPGDTALMTTPDAMPRYFAMHPRGAAGVCNKVAARIALSIVRYVPGRHSREIRCPVMFGICTNDEITPPDAAIRAAKQAPLGEYVTYPSGHFDIYTGAPFETVVADQIAFLRRTAPPRA